MSENELSNVLNPFSASAEALIKALGNGGPDHKVENHYVLCREALRAFLDRVVESHSNERVLPTPIPGWVGTTRGWITHCENRIKEAREHRLATA